VPCCPHGDGNTISWRDRFLCEMARRRSSVLTLLVTFGFFFGGAALGLGIAYWCAPNSAFLSIVSFLVFPLSMFLGFPAWLGSACLTLIFNRAERQNNNPARGTAQFTPRGSWVFLPITIGVFLPVSLLAGLLAERMSFTWAASLYLVIGGLYGTGMWRLARTGLLPFPEEA
jgi:hypothetical protein